MSDYMSNGMIQWVRQKYSLINQVNLILVNMLEFNVAYESILKNFQRKIYLLSVTLSKYLNTLLIFGGFCNKQTKSMHHLEKNIYKQLLMIQF